MRSHSALPDETTIAPSPVPPFLLCLLYFSTHASLPGGLLYPPSSLDFPQPHCCERCLSPDAGHCDGRVSVSLPSLRSLPFVFTGREDSYPMDCARSNPVQEVHLCQRRVELRDRHVGSHVLRREALLGHDQSRRTYLTSLVKSLLFLVTSCLITHTSRFPSFITASDSSEVHFRCVSASFKLNSSARSWLLYENSPTLTAET